LLNQFTQSIAARIDGLPQLIYDRRRMIAEIEQDEIAGDGRGSRLEQHVKFVEQLNRVSPPSSPPTAKPPSSDGFGFADPPAVPGARAPLALPARKPDFRACARQYICCPPLIDSVDPVTNPPSSEHRNATPRAISCAWPSRPTGIFATIFSSTSAGTAATMSVSI